MRSVVLAAVAAAPVCLAQPDLSRSFLDPPDSARPHTWWHWMNGNVTHEGITADLEAMKRIGLGGAQIFNVSESIPLGNAPFMGSRWRDLFTHAVTEADRLGLELCFHNCAGWSSSGGPWITPEFAMQMVVTSEATVNGPQRFVAALPQPEVRLDFYRDIAVLAFPTPAEDARIPQFNTKVGYEFRYDQRPALDAYPDAAIIKPDSIIDLTPRFSDGRLNWEVPAGTWTVLRLGYTPTGKTNHPSPDAGRGLECDKMSRAAMDLHWANGIAPLLEDAGPLAGKTLNNSLIDSYEVGGQNWTAQFAHEFKKRRGYDILPFFPVLAGRVVESGEVSERFLWDFRRTIADLFADNYYSYFAELCHKNGLLASIEPYDGPFECLQVARDADIPMGEFWVGGSESSSCKLAASVAHAYGRRIVGAESFTADPRTGRWQNHPGTLKAIGDLVYTTGINRFIIHRYAHQPWMDKVPGMTMGQWGTHFERTNTWWDQGKPWVQYLTRSQYLLQQGHFVADVCYFMGDAAPNGATHNPALKTAGYDYDACGPDVLLHRMKVKDGRIVLPDGMSYRVLVLPDSPFMTARVAEKVKELVNAGATVIGPKPERSPSLAERGAGDAKLAEIAAELWGDATDAAGERTVGKGRVVWGRAPEEVLAASGVGPDCAFAGATGRMAWIHRNVSGADVYFVSNQKTRSQQVECTFRVSGPVPELWNAETRKVGAAPVWSEHDGVTTVPIRFDPAGSVFVVFRKPADPGTDHIVAVKGPAEAAPKTPMIEVTRAVYEATDGAGGAEVTEKVRELVNAGETRIPASNSVFGDPAYMHYKRLTVEWTAGGVPMSRTVNENAVVELADQGPETPAPWQFAVLGSGAIEFRGFVPGDYALSMARGEARTIHVGTLPEARRVGGPWKVLFPPSLGAPAEATFETPASWTEHPDPGVRYFSGTATYEKDLEIPAELLGQGKILELDLGRVECIAEVSLNGIYMGTWWKPPFSTDIGRVARPGVNKLRIRVTNLWINRLIGDEQYPEDVDWNGMPLKRWPEWLNSRGPRPVPERVTFTTWHHYTKDSPLVDSGLIGPVTLRPGVRVRVE